MVTKQLPQACKCGWQMKFPEAQVKTTCLCGSVWELGLGGVWFIQLEFAPFVAKVKSKHYEMVHGKPNKRKAGKKNVKSNSEISFEAAQYQKSRIGL